ncbi:MAG: Lrp/AsnC family transcriptional regulator [Thiolinea sp.]
MNWIIFDKKIIALLANQGRLSMTALAEQVGLSKTPVINRCGAAGAAGLYQRPSGALNYELLGESHVAFIQVTLSDTSAGLNAFNQAVAQLAAVEQCHMIAGNFDYLVKVRTADIQAYRRLLGEQIAALPHVAHTSTFVSMETVCDRQKASL